MYQLETTHTKKDPQSRLTIGDKGLLFILAHFKNMPRPWKMVDWKEKGCKLHYRNRNGTKCVGIEYSNEGVAERFYRIEELQSWYDDTE